MYTTLAFLVLLRAPHIYNISGLRVKQCPAARGGILPEDSLSTRGLSAGIRLTGRWRADSEGVSYGDAACEQQRAMRSFHGETVGRWQGSHPMV